jgi:hypothetical protein
LNYCYWMSKKCLTRGKTYLLRVKWSVPGRISCLWKCPHFFQLFLLLSCLFIDKKRNFIQDELLKAPKHREHHVNIYVTGVWFGFGLTVFNVTFNNIAAISWRSVLLVEETGGSGEQYRPITRHWQTVT